MVSHRQTLEGITSRIPNDPEKRHYILADLEGYDLNTVIKKVREVQKEFKLGDIWITSDAPKSFRLWCFSKRPFIEYIHILLHLFPLVDFGFFIWTVRRTAGTLRTSNKHGRPKQKVCAYLRGFEETEFPKEVVGVWYDTGLVKRGYTLKIEGLKEISLKRGTV